MGPAAQGHNQEGSMCGKDEEDEGGADCQGGKGGVRAVVGRRGRRRQQYRDDSCYHQWHLGRPGGREERKGSCNYKVKEEEEDNNEAEAEAGQPAEMGVAMAMVTAPPPSIREDAGRSPTCS
jgi:hypothetical protein